MHYHSYCLSLRIIQKKSNTEKRHSWKRKSDLHYESVFDFLLHKRAVCATVVVFGG